MMFYNGFNLLVDVVLVSITAFMSYRFGLRDGYLMGYGEGEADANDYAERAGDYYYESSREVFDYERD